MDEYVHGNLFFLSGAPTLGIDVGFFYDFNEVDHENVGGEHESDDDDDVGTALGAA